MKYLKSAILHSMTILFMLSGFFSVPAQSNQKLPTETESEKHSDEEVLYKQWYDAWLGKNYMLSTDLAIVYLAQCPNGKYEGYLRKYIAGASGGGRTSSTEELTLALIDSGIDVNAKTKEGKTYLMLAAMSGNTRIANALIEKGADLDVQEEHGWTALIYAVWSGNVGMVNLLTNSGLDLRLKDNAGRTAFDHALISKNQEIIVALKRI